MADVWLAEDQELRRHVAVKILHERYANDEQFVERFRREATHAAGLSHPNIVSIYDRGVAGGSYYIVMEYIEGRTLKELIVTRGPCPVPVAISYTRQMLAALRYAHKNGIIHRDIKPHNVLVDREGRVKVADFGIARAGASEMTEAGLDRRHRAVPLARAGARRPGRRELGSLLDGDRPLRAADGNGAVHRRDAGRDRDEAPLADARGTLGTAAGHPARSRPRRPARAREGAGRALPTQPSSIEISSSWRAAIRSARRRRRQRRWCWRVRARSTPRRRHASRRPSAAAAGGTYGGEERYRAYDGPARRRRSIWPWLLARRGRARRRGRRLVPLRQRAESDRQQQAARGAAVHGIVESKAVNLILDDGFEPQVRRLPKGDAAGRDRLRAVARRGNRARKGRDRHDQGLDGQEDRRRARRGRQAADGCRRDADAGRA